MDNPYAAFDHKLSMRVKKDDLFSLKDACSLVMIKTYVCSDVYLGYIDWLLRNSISKKQKLKWVIWKGLFDTYLNTDDYIRRKSSYPEISALLQTIKR